MAGTNTRKTANILMIVESILNLLALPLGLLAFGMAVAPLAALLESDAASEAAMATLGELYQPDLAVAITFLFLLVFAAARVVRGYRLREERGKGFLRLSLVQAAVFAAAGALPLVIGFDMTSTTIVSVLVAGALIAGRVFSLVRNHRLLNIIANVIAILAIVVCAVSFISMSALLFLIAVFTLLGIVFSRISFSVLRKIVVKTHAAEIIFGLVLLIITFSMLLTFFEPNMGSLADALWYCFAIVTTIGFGDLTAVTPFGRILSVILGIYGIVVVALITSIIVNFYGEMKTSPETDSGDEAGEEQTGSGHPGQV